MSWACGRGRGGDRSSGPEGSHVLSQPCSILSTSLVIGQVFSTLLFTLEGVDLPFLPSPCALATRHHLPGLCRAHGHSGTSVKCRCLLYPHPRGAGKASKLCFESVWIHITLFLAWLKEVYPDSVLLSPARQSTLPLSALHPQKRAESPPCPKSLGHQRILSL